MVEEHKEENGELKAEEETERSETESKDTERRREGVIDRKKEREIEAALLLFQTMTGNVAKDSHIVQQDTVQYIGFISDTVCSQMNWKCGQEWVLKRCCGKITE